MVAVRPYTSLSILLLTLRRSARHGQFPGRRSNEDSTGSQLSPRKPDASGTPGEPTGVPESIITSITTQHVGGLVNAADVMDVIIDKALENSPVLKEGRLKLQIVTDAVSWEERLVTLNEVAILIRHPDGDLRYRLKLLEMSECRVNKFQRVGSQVLLHMHILCNHLPCTPTSPCHDVRVA